MHAFKTEDISLSFEREFQEIFLQGIQKEKDTWERKFIARDATNDQPQWVCYQYEEGKEEEKQPMNDRIQKDFKKVKLAEVESDDLAKVLNEKIIELRLKDNRFLYSDDKGGCLIGQANSGKDKEDISVRQRRFKAWRHEMNTIELAT